MEVLSNDTITTMRYSKVSTTPDCNCTDFLRSVRKHGMPVNGRLPKVCKSAMAHFAWRKGCEELLQLHAQTCLAAYSDEEDESHDEEGKEEEEAEHFGVRLLLIVAEEDVLVQRVKGIVEEEEEEEEEEEKVIALFSLSLFY